MAKTLFIGDSHTAGYTAINDKVTQWGENGYPHYFSAGKQTLVYALPGASNQKYPIWIKSMLDRHNDIDEIFVQSTYWNRWLMGASISLEYHDDSSSDLFLDDTYICPINKNIKYYTDFKAIDTSIEIVEQCRSELFEQFKGLEFAEDSITKDWPPFTEKYVYSKLYNECLTHLQYREYATNLFVINSLCKERGIKWYLWSINDRVYMPKRFDLFGELTECTIVKENCREYFIEKHNRDIDAERTDGEHYSKEVHELIADKYIPYVRNQR